MTQVLGGRVERTGKGEYGRTTLSRFGSSALFSDWPPVGTSDVWMSHGDAITEAPPGFVATASTPDAPVAALHDPDLASTRCNPSRSRPHRARPEPDRKLRHRCLARVLRGPTPTSSSPPSRRSVRRSARRVLCGLWGGVDSAVAAALVDKAIGDQLTCVFVDTGLMRAGEGEQVEGPSREVPGGPRPREGRGPVLLSAERLDRPQREAKGDRRDLHKGLRRGRPRARGRKPSRPGRALSRRHRVGHRRRHGPSGPTTTWAGSPTTWRSRSWNRSGSSSKTR